MYVLTLFLAFSASLASSTSEFNSKETCEYAIRENKKIAMASEIRISVVFASCMPKAYSGQLPTAIK